MALADTYRRDGWLAVPDLLSGSEVDALREETRRICSGAAGDVVGVDPSAADPALGEDAALADIIAIHFPHKISSLMRGALAHPGIVDVLTQLIGPNVKAMQSMLFAKPAGKPGQAWHQDEFYIPTRDRSLAGAWIALDDASVENGCLWMLSGSHRRGVLWPMREHGDVRFDFGRAAYDFPDAEDDAVPVEVSAGSVVFFHGYVLHRSLPNHAAAGFRRALVNHYMSAESLLPWGIAGPRADFRDIVMVAGDDPYAYKGIESLTTPFVRAESPERQRAVREALTERAPGTAYSLTVPAEQVPAEEVPAEEVPAEKEESARS